MIRLIFTFLIGIGTLSFGLAQECGDGSTPTTTVISLTGATSAGAIGSLGNTVGSACFPAEGDVVALEWDGIDLDPIGASWCSEATLDFEATLSLTVAVGEDNAGPCGNGYSSGGYLDLVTLGLGFPTDGAGCIVWEAFETYDDDDGDTPDNTFTAGTVTLYSCPLGVALPVTISKLVAREAATGNSILCETSTEINSKYIIVERSKDGNKWTELERLDAQGSSDATTSYEVFDDNPYMKSYYRIHTIDLNGEEDFSHVVSVIRDISRFEVRDISPNPFVEDITVTVSAHAANNLFVTLTNSVGQTVYSSTRQVEEGVSNVNIDASLILPGIYQLTVRMGDWSENQTIIKK